MTGRNMRQAMVMILGVAGIVLVNVAQAASKSWNTGSSTWDDVTPANWNTGTVPVSGDGVTINRATDTTVDYASGLFAAASSNLAGLTLGGSGASNILQLGAGDTLNYTNVININNGGRLEMSGGTISDATASGWHDSLKINNGGSVRITGGLFQIPLQANTYLADTAGHTASLEVSGSGILSNTAAVNPGADLSSRSGNSTLTLADNGVIQIRREILVGTVSGNHTWTISGGIMRAMAVNYSSNAMRFGGGSGSVTVNQTGGTVYSQYQNISRGATYNLSGGTNQAVNAITLGEYDGENATLNITGGLLTTAAYDLSAAGGNSTLTLNNAVIDIKRDILVGTTGGSHLWMMTNGTMRTGSSAKFGGGNGTVTAAQTGGTVYSLYQHIAGGATYTLNSGICIASNTFYLADAADQSATLTVNGGILTNVNYDLTASAGNSTLTLANDGVIQIKRNILVGTIGGTHNWTISGGAMRSLAATGTKFGGGNGSVTVMQTGGLLTSPSLTIGAGTTYTLGGGTNMVDNTINFADAAGQSATLNVSGGVLTNLNNDLSATAGNSTLSLSAGEINSPRDILVGTTGGTHNWTISGGIMRSIGATTGTKFGGGSGSVTVTQTGGILTSASQIIAGGTTYNLGGGTNVAANNIYLADVAGQSATLNVSGGLLTNVIYDLRASAGNSTVNLSNGEINIKRSIFVGTAGGTHNWTISGGLLNIRANTETGDGIGSTNGTGSVTITQTGGLVKVNLLHMFGTTTVNLQAGAMTNQTEYMDGTFTQSGGSHYIANDIMIGTVAGRTGTYTMVNGAFRSRGFTIGRVPDSVGSFTMNAGTFAMANNASGADAYFTIGANSGSGSGTLTLKGGTIGGTSYSLTGMVVNATGTVRGYGTISVGAYRIYTAGRVIADGEGADHTLNLTSFSVVSNFIDNVTDKGWFAINHGRLLLPKVAVNASTSSNYNWGEQQDDTTIDLVNSARFEFTGLSGNSGSLTGAVVAVDRPGASPFGEWGISAHEFAVTNATFSTCTLTIRYDDIRAGSRSDPIALYQRTGSLWVRIPATIDPVNRWVTASNLTALGRFSLTFIPPGGIYSIR